jgi:hypothetical protein
VTGNLEQSDAPVGYLDVARAIEALHDVLAAP